MTLKFGQWDSLNESNVFDQIKNWLSSTFGGKIEKLDQLANEYKAAEIDFVDKWEDIHVEIDKLELERSQTKSDPAEIKRIDRLIERNNQLMNAQSRAHEKSTDAIFAKVRDVISDSKRTRTYWEKLKTNIDAEIAEQMYDKAKSLADSSLSGSLYAKYKNAVLKAKQKDADFKARYGNLMSKDIEYGKKTSGYQKKEKSKETTEPGNTTDASFEFLVKLPIVEFSDAIKSYEPEKIKKLISFLIKERNDRYVAMDMERDILNKEIENSSDREDAKKKAASRIKEIREKYMGEIRDLRSKITVAKKNA